MNLAHSSRAAPRRALGQVAGALRIEEIDRPAALDALAPEWRALFDADPEATPFQSPAWLLAWRRAFLSEGLFALAVRRDGELVGLAPFFIHRDPPSGRRQLTLLGNGVSDRQGLVARPEARAAVAAAVAAGLAERRGRWDTADFRDLPEGSPLLAAALAPGAAERIEPEPPCPVLDLPDEPEAVLARLPKSRRTDLRRCARRLSAFGPLEFGCADPSGRRAHLEALARLHGARWRARGEGGVLAEAAVRAFHEDAAEALMAAGLLRLEALRLGGRVIAAHYVLRRGRCAYSYLHAFDPAFAAFGPGWLLMAWSLQTAVREGVRRFDFLRGREAYKYAWGAIDQPQFRRRIWLERPAAP